MKVLVYLLIMTFAYPLWKLSTFIMDALFAVHKKLIKWIEK